MRKYIILAVSLLAIISCVKESVAPEQKITGIFALDDGSGLSDEYLEFKNGYLTTWSAKNSQEKTFAEGKYWNFDKNDFNRKSHTKYSIIDDVLYAEGTEQGEISISEDNLKLYALNYTRVKGFESECYSVIKPYQRYFSVPYVQSDVVVPCSIFRSIPAGIACVKSKPSFVSSASFDGEKLIFTVGECQSKSDRSGRIVLAYTNAKDVEIEVKQEQQTFIFLPRNSVRVTYMSAEDQFSYSIENPVDGASLSAKCPQNWVHDITIDGNIVSFSYDENNSKSLRTANIVCSYPGAKDVSFTLEQLYLAPTINTDPSTTTATYSGGSFLIDYSIDNPREDAELTATSTDSWISGIKVENGQVSFNVAENNSSAQRSGTIKLSYGVSGTVLASKNYTVTQTGKPVNSLTLNKTSLEMNVGTSETLVATVTPSDVALTWSSSNAGVATVDGNGKVTAKANGTATITVTTADGAKTAACSVTVTTAVTGVTLNKTTLSLIAGSSETLVATVAPSTASNKEVTWSSSSTSVATVDGNGKVTAIAKGTATITVKTADGAKAATCTVTVTTIPVTGVTLNKTTLSLNVGSSETLVATVAPSTATNKEVTWSSSNTSVATVDDIGKVTAKANGTATITVKTADGSKAATCSVTVTTAVTGVSLNKTTLSLNVDSSENLIATVAPSTASNKDVTWSSSNTGVATVDVNGKVTAIAKGTATITVKTADGDKAATCAVTVTTIPVTGVTLNKTTLSLNVGSSETLIATITPSTASNKSVTWSSSNTGVATVDGNGKVTAVANGSATIAVKTVDGDRTSTCAVTVKNPCPVDAVDLGLSVYWATCNLGASNPSDFGDWYAWGATEPWYKDGYAQSLDPQWKSGKTDGYDWSTCPFNGGNSDFNESYWNAHKSECVDANNVLLPANDAAHVNLGGNWRMPTIEEFDELINTSNCSWTRTTLNGHDGYKVQSKKTGYTDNWIFLPFAASWVFRRPLTLGNLGYYWSSSLSLDDYRCADLLCYSYFSDGGFGTGHQWRYLGLPVRPVSE